MDEPRRNDQQAESRSAPRRWFRAATDAIKNRPGVELSIDITVGFTFCVAGEFLIPNDATRHALSFALFFLGFFASITIKAHYLHTRRGILIPSDAIQDIFATHDAIVRASKLGHKELLDQTKRLLGLYATPGTIDFIETCDRHVSSPLQTTIEQMARASMIDTLFRSESERLRKQESIHTNTNVYTELYWAATTLLTELAEANTSVRRITRFHITAMLPEEFFNGMQVAYFSHRPEPTYLRRIWNDYEYLYEKYDLSKWPGLTVRRCIVVRDLGEHIAEIGALKTVKDLEEQAKLSISKFCKHKSINNDLTDECPGVIERIFDTPNCPIDAKDLKYPKVQALVKHILGREPFRYFPICNGICRVSTNQYCRDSDYWQPLLEVYATKYHKLMENALYCSIGAHEWGRIKDQSLLRSCFREGCTPEVVLFGNENSTHWYFGYLGRYLPGTPNIELRFLNSIEASSLYAEFVSKVCTNGEPLPISSLRNTNPLTPKSCPAWVATTT